MRTHRSTSMAMMLPMSVIIKNPNILKFLWFCLVIFLLINCLLKDKKLRKIDKILKLLILKFESNNNSSYLNYYIFKNIYSTI